MYTLEGVSSVMLMNSLRFSYAQCVLLFPKAIFFTFKVKCLVCGLTKCQGRCPALKLLRYENRMSNTVECLFLCDLNVFSIV